MKLYVREADNEIREATDAEVTDTALAILSASVRRGEEISDPDAFRKFLRMKLGKLDHEVFAVLYLDSQNRVIEFVEMFRGTVDAVAAHPRDIVRYALLNNASAVVLSHNHPSTNTRPSQADIVLTRHLRNAFEFFGVSLLDHLIVGADDYSSFVELGLM